MTESHTTMRVGDRSLTVREITIADIERLRRMFNRLSPDSVYRRFFSPIQEPSRTALLWLTSVDHGSRDALVALDGDEIVAVARYDGKPDRNTAEIAVTVEDAWQRRGRRAPAHPAPGRARDRPRHRVVRSGGAARQPRRAQPAPQAVTRRGGALRRR